LKKYLKVKEFKKLNIKRKVENILNLKSYISKKKY